jgi:glucosamine--fructose-6-phosphate aminotransferase (isomerizing)
LRASAYNGHLDASTAVRLTTVLRYALGLIPLDSYQLELGKIGTPSVVLEDLAQALAYAIDELTRPIDAIKHQAEDRHRWHLPGRRDAAAVATRQGGARCRHAA